MSQDKSQIFKDILAQRIMVLDGGMGTQIQSYKLDEADYRGERFADWGQDLKGNNDLLTLTQPDLIRDIMVAYLEAGADIVETNTFNSTSIAQADYGMEELVYELNKAGAELAREACESVATEDKPRFVAGVLGPTNRTASISPDVNDPGYRNVSFDELVESYTEALRGLVDGGADLLLIETIFDTLNAKAAIFAIEKYFSERIPPSPPLEKGGDTTAENTLPPLSQRGDRGDLPERLPIMISGTITDASGRTLSGQTTEAFYNSLRHARPLFFGLNCALGPDALRQYVAELNRIAECHVCAHPNAGLPNEFGEYDLGPEEMAEQIEEWAESGLLNMIGGCCGTTPEHIRAIAEAVEGKAPRKLPELPPALRLSGLEPFNTAA